jgi:hypothetical protein
LATTFGDWDRESIEDMGNILSMYNPPDSRLMTEYKNVKITANKTLSVKS